MSKYYARKGDGSYTSNIEDKVQWLLDNPNDWLGRPDLTRNQRVLMAYKMKRAGLYAHSTTAYAIADNLPKLISHAKSCSCGREVQ
jgi:hypothetical protein